MRSCPVLANITRCPQTRRAPSVPPRTAGPEQGKGVRAAPPGLLSGPDGAGRARPGRSSARGRESSSAAAAPPWTFIGGWGEGRKGSNGAGRWPARPREGADRRQAGKPWPRGRTFYKPLRLGVAALCGVRGAGDSSRCEPRRVGGCRPGFGFLKNNHLARQVFLKGGAQASSVSRRRGRRSSFLRFTPRAAPAPRDPAPTPICSSNTIAGSLTLGQCQNPKVPRSPLSLLVPELPPTPCPILARSL